MLMINRSMPPVRTQIIGSGCFRCSSSHICRGKKKLAITKNMLTTTPSRTVRPNHLAHVFDALDPAFVNAEEVFTVRVLTFWLSKSLCVLDQSILLLGRQISSIKVALISVTRDGRVIKKMPAAIFFANIGHKAEFLLIEDVVAPVKFNRPLFRELKQVTQSGNRPIV